MHLHLVESVSNRLHKVHWHRGHDPPILTYNTSLDDWPSVLGNQPDRFVEKVESCIAHTSKRDELGMVVDKHHDHAFVRITLAPCEGEPETVIFVERAIDHAGHSVIPVITSPSAATNATATDALSFQDHACMIHDGAHSEFAHKPKMDRSLVFGGCKDRRLSLHELATVFQFITRNGPMSVGEDCVAHSLWFARTCVAALKSVMYGSFHCITPPRGDAAVKVDVVCEDAIDLFIDESFKPVYPAMHVAEENRRRQLDAMCEEERAKKILEIEKWHKMQNDRDTVLRMMQEIRKDMQRSVN